MLEQRLISLSEPILGTEEIDAVNAVIEDRWLTMGDRVRKFEKAFAEHHCADDAVAVNSCTAALHVILTAIGIGSGDEVLVPSLSFVATSNAVLYVGAKPVFVDIKSEDCPHISISDADQKCNYRTRAVIIMHYGGYRADIEAWRSFCDKRDLMLIEDAAHAPGLNGVGLFSDAAAFSFFSNKNMSTAEGGMIVARDKSLLERTRMMRAHGMTTDTLSRYKGHAYSYDVTELGYNYRLDELRAAIGQVQLSHLTDWNRKRTELSDCYRIIIAETVPDIKIPFAADHETTAHLLPVLLPGQIDREKVMNDLRGKGIQTSIHYPPIHNFTYYRRRFPDLCLSLTEDYCARELTLPLHPMLSHDDVEYVIAVLKSLING